MLGHPLKGNLLLSCKPLHLEAQQRLQEEGCVVDINDNIPDEQLAVINASRDTPWYADYANYIVAKFIPPSFTYQQNKKFFYDLRHYFWDDPHIYKGVDGVIRRCVPEHEQEHILCKCHSEAYGGHHVRWR